MIYILLVLVVVKEGPKIDIYLVNSNRQNVALHEAPLIIIIYQKKVTGEIIKERERDHSQTFNYYVEINFFTYYIEYRTVRLRVWHQVTNESNKYQNRKIICNVE